MTQSKDNIVPKPKGGLLQQYQLFLWWCLWPLQLQILLRLSWYHWFWWFWVWCLRWDRRHRLCHCTHFTIVAVAVWCYCFGQSTPMNQSAAGGASQVQGALGTNTGAKCDLVASQLVLCGQVHLQPIRLQSYPAKPSEQQDTWKKMEMDSAAQEQTMTDSLAFFAQCWFDTYFGMQSQQLIQNGCFHFLICSPVLPTLFHGALWWLS